MEISYSLNISFGKPDHKNINTPGYWDMVWKREGRGTWRIYPETNKRIIEEIGSGKKVLEVGCGVGILLKQIMDNNNKVTGIDISQYAVSILKEHGIEGVQSALPNIPFNDNSFDVVGGAEILEHMDDDKELLVQCLRVCKKGGKVIFAVPDDRLGPEREKEHMRKYTYDDFSKLLSSFSKKVSVQRFTDTFSAECNGRTIRISLPVLMGVIIKE